MFAKLIAHIPAAILANSVMQNLPDDLPIDLNIEKPNTRSANGMAWELQRIFHKAVCETIESANWQSPKMQFGTELAETLKATLPLITNPVVKGLIESFVGQMTAPAVAPVPNPSA